MEVNKIIEKIKKAIIEKYGENELAKIMIYEDKGMIKFLSPGAISIEAIQVICDAFNECVEK